MGNIEVLQQDDEQWYFHVKAKNGRILCHSEGYANKRDCVDAAELIAAGGGEVIS